LRKSLKRDLVGGKPALQNEILGDLQQEFTSAFEKGEELSLEEPGSTLATDFSGSLGSTSLVSSVAKCLVVSPHPLFVHIPVRLDPSHTDGVHLLATTFAEPK